MIAVNNTIIGLRNLMKGCWADDTGSGIHVFELVVQVHGGYLENSL